MTIFFPIAIASKPLSTPAKHPLAVPSKALADAIVSEWETHKKYSAGNMPLTTLAYTAIDRVAPEKELMVETLLVYVDTDTLSYRATGSEKLSALQEQQWNPILAWAKKLYGATWEVTTGVMPLEQPQALHHALEKRLHQLDAWQLSACCLLASGLSSLVLMLAVLEKHIPVAEAFGLSRLEEESQAEAWGRDNEADTRAARLKEELLASARFLSLLQAP